MSTGKNKEVRGAQVSAPETSQGEVTQETHVVTQETLNANPDLIGVVEVGETIGLGEVVASGDEKYTVIAPFADKDIFSKKWEEGDDVSHFDESRLANCIEKGLVKKG